VKIHTNCVFYPGKYSNGSGIFTYKMMMGVITLQKPNPAEYSKILNDTVHNGMLALFMLLSLAVGAALPLLIVRKNQEKNFSLLKYRH